VTQEQDVSNRLTDYYEQRQRDQRATMYEPLEAQRARLEAEDARMRANAERIEALLAERAQARRVGVSETTQAPAPPLTTQEDYATRQQRWAVYQQTPECHENYREMTSPPAWFV